MGDGETGGEAKGSGASPWRMPKDGQKEKEKDSIKESETNGRRKFEAQRRRE